MRTFAATTGILDELGMNIMDTRIVPMKNNYSIDTYVFIDKDINKITTKTIQKLEFKLASFLDRSDQDIHVSRRPPRITKHFATKSELIFKDDSPNNRTILEIVTKDEPGLLSKIGQVFKNLDINIQTAKIITIGERAEDVFFIVDKNGQPLSKKLMTRLKHNLREYIG
jgi:[protein-PII] uridylyltransferase